MIDIWHEYGCQVAVLVNHPHGYRVLPEADMVILQKEWRGFPVAANILCQRVPADIVVVVGDDLYPDPNTTAQQVGEEMLSRFPDLYGVVQPTGDRYGLPDICCISPWIGQTFIERAYRGRGPYWEGYYHYFADHELQLAAEKLGVFQQRPDLVQYHDHWQRKGEFRPKYLRQAKREHRKDKLLCEQRKREGFPGL